MGIEDSAFTRFVTALHCFATAHHARYSVSCNAATNENIAISLTVCRLETITAQWIVSLEYKN